MGSIAGGHSHRVATFAGTAQGCGVEQEWQTPSCYFDMRTCYGLAVDSDSGVVYALRSHPGGIELISYDPDSGLPDRGRGWFRGPFIGNDLRSLVYDTQRNLLYGVWGRREHRVGDELRNGCELSLWALPSKRM